jgi:DNA-binding IclR family transcriptional regulator
MISAHLLRASADIRLRRDDFRALIQAHGELDWEEYRPLKMQAIGRALRLTRANTSRAVRRLVLYGYLAPGPKDGALRTYRLRTPSLGVTGDTSHAA